MTLAQDVVTIDVLKNSQLRGMSDAQVSILVNVFVRLSLTKMLQ